MKAYVVYFYIKAHRTEYLADVTVRAKTAKDACKLAKAWYYEMSGKNAFRPTTKKPSDEAIKWYADRCNIRHFQSVVTESAVAELQKS